MFGGFLLHCLLNRFPKEHLPIGSDVTPSQTLCPFDNVLLGIPRAGRVAGLHQEATTA